MKAAKLVRMAIRAAFPLTLIWSLGAESVPKGLTASDWGGIRAEYDRHRHAVAQVNGAYHARNATQQWIARFDGRGFLVEPDRGAWKWGLELKGYGYAGKLQLAPGRARVTVSANRVAYDWDSVLQEWFVNRAQGLEHGFTLWQRPPGGDGRLELLLAVRGKLQPQAQEAGLSAIFADEQKLPVVRYAGLKAWDAEGHALGVRMREAPDGLRFELETGGARFPVTIDPTAQQAYLKASNTAAEDSFGNSVAVSGDTVVVGARGEDSAATGVNGNQADNSAPFAGAAYIFVRTGGIWSQQAYLKASNTGANDQFGNSVAISGNTVVVGAFREDSAATGVNGNQADNSATESGAAYVFVRTGGIWSQQAYLKASNTGAFDQFGYSVTVSGETIVAGAFSEDSAATGVNGNQADNAAPESGAAYVFVRAGGNWSQQAYLKASNTGMHDQFGYSVAISGDTLVAGAYGEASGATGVNGNQADNSATYSGAAYVFARTAGIWSQQAYLKASNTGAQDFFGYSVAVSGDTVAIGAFWEDSAATGVNGNQFDNSATDSGAAYVFVRAGGVWSQQAYLKASNTEAYDQFGSSVAVSGDTLVAGAPSEDSAASGVNGNEADNSAYYSGAAYVFVRTGGIWSQQAYLKASNTGEGDTFGDSVAISGDTVVAGAYLEDYAGAAYVFAIATPPGLRFVPVTPCRVVDTRAGQGTTGNFGPPAMNAGTTRDFPIPSGRCAIPSSARAYSFNATVVPLDPAFAYLTLWPTGQPQPFVSTLNSFHGGVVANAAIVPAGIGGSVSAFVTNKAELILDINGYFADSSGLSFYALNPCRLADTRVGGGFSGLFGPPILAAQSARSFPLPAGSCGVPPNAGAYSLNVTVVPPAPLAFLTAWPTGQARPFVSTLNSFDGAVVANAALIPAGSDGGVSLFVTEASEAILDINGHFAAAGGIGELQFHTVTPCRVADTRVPGLGYPTMNSGETRDFLVVTKCGTPEGAKAFSLNVTVVPEGALAYLTLWPAGDAQPYVSTLNSFLGRVAANAAIVPASPAGAISVYVTNRTEVILDINGYFR